MANLSELLNGHATLEVECLDRLYWSGYIGKLATSGGWGDFPARATGQAHPVAHGAGTGYGFREAVRVPTEQDKVPICQFDHKERKDDVAHRIRRQREVRDGVVFIGVARDKAPAFSGKKIGGQFEFTRDKTV